MRSHILVSLLLVAGISAYTLLHHEHDLLFTRDSLGSGAQEHLYARSFGEDAVPVLLSRSPKGGGGKRGGESGGRGIGVPSQSSPTTRASKKHAEPGTGPEPTSKAKASGGKLAKAQGMTPLEKPRQKGFVAKGGAPSAGEGRQERKKAKASSRKLGKADSANDATSATPGPKAKSHKKAKASAQDSDANAGAGAMPATRSRKKAKISAQGSDSNGADAGTGAIPAKKSGRKTKARSQDFESNGANAEAEMGPVTRSRKKAKTSAQDFDSNNAGTGMGETAVQQRKREKKGHKVEGKAQRAREDEAHKAEVAAQQQREQAEHAAPAQGVAGVTGGGDF